MLINGPPHPVQINLVYLFVFFFPLGKLGEMPKACWYIETKPLKTYHTQMQKEANIFCTLSTV